MTDTAKPLPEPIWIILNDSFTGIRFWYESTYAMHFRVYSVCQPYDAITRKPVGYELINCGEVYPLVDWEKAFWEIDGAVKWDGCINWQTNEECMAHGCSPTYSKQIAAIFDTVYAIGKRNLDFLDDPAPPLPTDALELPV